MPKVFVVNNMMHDYSAAAKYGELINVTEGKVPIFKTDTMISILKDKLADFTEDDYLLISGPVLISIIAVPMLFKKVSMLKLLVFDAKKQEYVVRHINHGNL